jgi:scyllo-inositol 2-dehydrogenase (NADP+)
MAMGHAAAWDAPVAVGIAGLGRSGWNIHAEALAAHPGYRVVAVADPVPERREEAQARFACAAYAEPEELLQDAAVELAVLATPSHTHAPLALASLAAGRHTLVEKPMAQDLAEMDAMMAAAAAARRLLTCYQPYRFHATFVALQGLIASGRLGRVVLVKHTQNNFLRRADWQMLRRLGGGELSNNGPHIIDQALLLLGEGPVELCADLQHTVGGGDAEDHVKLWLKGSSGMVVDIELSHCCALPQPEWMVFGTAGALVSADGGLRVRWFDPTGLPEPVVDEGPAAGRRYQRPEELPWQEELLHPEQGRPAALRFYDDLYEALRTGRPPAVRLETVRRQIELIQRARQQTGLR